MCFAPAYTYIPIYVYCAMPGTLKGQKRVISSSETGVTMFMNPNVMLGTKSWSSGRVASANAPALQQNCLKVLEFERKFLSCMCAVFAFASTAHQSTTVHPQGRKVPTKHGSVPNGHWGHVGMPYPKQHHPQNQ